MASQRPGVWSLEVLRVLLEVLQVLQVPAILEVLQMLEALCVLWNPKDLQDRRRSLTPSWFR
jgi:hypothetical protein